MTKKERVRAALTNAPVDQVPVSFWRHFAGEDARGVQCVQRHIDFYRRTDLDFIKVMHDGLVAPCSLDVKDASDLWRYRPMGEKNPYIADYVERCCRIVDALGGEVYVYCNVFPAMTLLRRIGDEKLAALIESDRAAVLHAMDVMSEEIALLSRLVIEKAGCLGIFAAFQGAERNRFTRREDFDGLVRPFDLRVLEAANGVSPYNLLHFCGWDGVPNHLEYYLDYPGCAVNWAIYVDNLSLAEGRKYFGGRPVMGGFDNRRTGLLYSGTREEIEAETRRLVSDYAAATGGTDGLIIGADCSFLTDFELERFSWVRETLAAMR